MSYNDSNTTSPEEKSQKVNKKEKKKDQQNKNWEDKWGDDELWESLNK